MFNDRKSTNVIFLEANYMTSNKAKGDTNYETLKDSPILTQNTMDPRVQTYVNSYTSIT